MRTRRLIEAPVLQNIPVRTGLGKSLVEAFRPKGYEFLELDYSGLEMRIFALLWGSDD